LSALRREILIDVMSASSWAINLACIPMVRSESIVDRPFRPWLDLTKTEGRITRIS
jgi:hypothetical protein